MSSPLGTRVTRPRLATSPSLGTNHTTGSIVPSAARTVQEQYKVRDRLPPQICVCPQTRVRLRLCERVGIEGESDVGRFSWAVAGGFRRKSLSKSGQ